MRAELARLARLARVHVDEGELQRIGAGRRSDATTARTADAARGIVNAQVPSAHLARGRSSSAAVPLASYARRVDHSQLYSRAAQCGAERVTQRRALVSITHAAQHHHDEPEAGETDRPWLGRQRARERAQVMQEQPNVVRLG